MVVPCTLLLSLPSMALRLVANLQSWRRLGVATLLTGKQGVIVGSPIVPHGGGLIWVKVFTLAGAIPVDCAQTMLPGTLDVARIRTPQVKIATKALIVAFLILVTTTLSLLGLRPRGGYGPQNEKAMNHKA